MAESQSPTLERQSSKRCRTDTVTRKLELLALRSMELADRAAANELPFTEAVDMAWSAAVWADLPAAIERSGLIDNAKISGEDVVQATLAGAFANARRPE